ncbi:hypothetical protein ABZ754_01885 [Micromonospora purpureochromogenes]|uniref:hypothetical protein n=1 Tax=Micromonospora purpureochromogenes TaxID=47872 RepID=UPI0033F206D1
MDHSPLRPDLPHLPAERVRVRRDALLREIAPPRRRSVTAARRRLALAAVGLATLAAAGGAVALTGYVEQPGPGVSGTAPADGPTAGPDGTVLVEQDDMADPTAANAELRRVGARAVLVTTRPEADCPRQDRGDPVPQDISVYFGSKGPLTLPASGGVRIHPDRIPEGLMLAVHLRAQEVNGSYLSGWEFYRLPGPGCVVAGPYRSFDDPTPGPSTPR